MSSEDNYDGVKTGGFSDLLMDPPESWTWCLGMPEHPKCPECGTIMDYCLTISQRGRQMEKNYCPNCGYETDEHEDG